jgi:3-phosphoshikimate 1-carboxyvinyltransferase
MSALEIPTVNRPIDATAHIPGSKSITNRALLITALADGPSLLENALFSEDTHWFSTCLHQLGVPVESDSASATFSLTGMGGAVPTRQADLFVGNAGTAARFITAMVALATTGTYRMDGIPRMRERPMGELLSVLKGLGTGVHFEKKPGYMPFTIESHGFEGGTILLKAAQTSQQLSALLMIAPYARQDTLIVIDGELVSRPYVTMTCRMMADFGVEVVEPDETSFAVRAGQRYTPRRYIVEPDASNATYFFAAAAITGGRMRIDHLTNSSCQGDALFVDVLAEMGCTVTRTDTYTEVRGTSTLRGVDVDLNDMSDTVQTLAAIAPFASSPVTIRNVEHIRWKETDRVEAVVTELERMGIRVDTFTDGMTIHPGTPAPAAIETYDDHRMAMAFAVTGLRTPGLFIKHPECTRKTFPDFFDHFLKLTEQ